MERRRHGGQASIRERTSTGGLGRLVLVAGVTAVLVAAGICPAAGTQRPLPGGSAAPAAVVSGTVAASAAMPTSVTIQAPRTCAPKQTITVTATVCASGTPLSGVRVIIERVWSLTSFSVVASGTTDGAGHFRITARPQSRIVYRARFAGDALHQAGTSMWASVYPKVKYSAPWTHGGYAYPGQRLPARGTLWPKHSKYSTSTVIVCDRWEKGKWVTRAKYRAVIVNTTTSTSSRYRSVIKLPYSGYWRVRARHIDKGHAKTLGPVTKIKVTNWRRRYVGKRCQGFKTKQKLVAITIDDGPNKRTLEICSILEKYGGRGTFFFTNTALRHGYGPQAKKAYDRGHEIANHTAHHRMLYGYSSSLSEVTIPKRTIRAATGFNPIWVRAMGGGIDSGGMRAVIRSDQLYCNWSLDSYDSHQGYTAPSTLYRIVMHGVNPGDVILIHQTHPESVEALPRICRELKRRGYKMVTLSELAARSTSR